MAMSSHAPSSRGEQNYRYFSQANINGQQHDDALSNTRQQTDTRAPRRQQRHKSDTHTYTGINTINRILDSHSSAHTCIHTNTIAHAETKLNADSAPSFAFCCRCFGWWLVAAQFQYEKPVTCEGGVTLNPVKLVIDRVN